MKKRKKNLTNKPLDPAKLENLDVDEIEKVIRRRKKIPADVARYISLN